MPLIAEPRKIQIVKLMLDNVPIIAPFELAKGTNIAKIKSDSNKCSDSLALHIRRL